MAKKTKAAGIAALVLLICAPGTGHADLILNGGFETLTNGFGQIGYNTNATGWQTTGYNFVFGPGTADTTGVTGSDGPLSLWGPGNGSANGLPSSSPNGGNYIAADGAYEIAPITQTVNGLTVGKTYQLSFDWAAAQQSGFNGPTTDQWIVSFGNMTLSTPVLSIPSHGFSGWQTQSFDYVASSSSEVLSFLANGTPSGVPPFALLDGVTINRWVCRNRPPWSSCSLVCSAQAFSPVVAPSLRNHARKLSFRLGGTSPYQRLEGEGVPLSFKPWPGEKSNRSCVPGRIARQV